MTGQTDCLFCRIAVGEIPATLVYRDDQLTAIRDVNPRAPTHILLMPNQHIASTSDLQPEQDALAGRLMRVAATIAAQEGIAASGYRLVSNCGADSGQTVPHLHFHLLGGRQLGWPPG